MLASLTQGSIYTEAMFLHEAKIGQPDFIIDFFNFDQTAKRTIGALKITREVTSEGNQHRRDIESSHHHDDPYVVHLLGQRRAEVGDTVLEDISVSLPTADPKVSIDLPINDFLLGLTTLQKEGEGYSLVVPVFNGRKYCPTGMRILATEEVIQKACACLDNKPTEVFNKNFVVENLTQFVRNVT
ncbi:hypothetical protein HY030_01265 [Candidatus Gottesmanbacteria bacterium]|nr:hypothetical protein [Candidatus Gottesmanbacteria bacterium]